VEDIDFWVNFVAENSNKLQKLGLEGKISWALNVFYILFFIENVFTLGPMAQATLVFMNIHFIKEEGSYICAYKRSEKVWMWIESFW
jgi:hypothetical protein